MMSDEIKGLLKTLTMRMIDALGIWRDESNPEEKKAPTWSEKEVAIVNYMSSRKNLDVLINTVQNVLDTFKDINVFRYVTRGFITSTLGLLKDYRDCEFPEEELVVKAAETETTGEQAPVTETEATANETK